MPLSRRSFLKQTLAATGALAAAKQAASGETQSFRLAAFAADVTPPIGSPLCAGLVKPSVGASEPLEALGIVMLGSGRPIVLCAVDFCGLCNADHLLWRSEIAKAAGTSADRVAVQSLHQHNAPLADTAAHELLQGANSPIAIHDLAWMKRALAGIAEAVRKATASTQPLTHIAVGEAKVDRVGSNRRVMGPDGRVRFVRTSATKNPEVRAAAEGTIDPLVKSIAFYSGEEKLAVLHYYATHPMSYYGDGVVTSDFVGLARQRRKKADQVPHIYFTGCGGNITAGKYNDGDPKNRAVLAERLHDAMVAAERAGNRMPLETIQWRAMPVNLPRSEYRQEDALGIIGDESQPASVRTREAMRLSYDRFASQGNPILFTSLGLNGSVRIVHLPGEPFVEYQLFAQEAAVGKFIAVAGYGDCGPGYIPLERSFAEGGYEPTWAFAAPTAENVIRQAIASLAAGASG
jgi:hypothetical protein